MMFENIQDQATRNKTDILSYWLDKEGPVQISFKTETTTYYGGKAPDYFGCLRSDMLDGYPREVHERIMAKAKR